MALSITITSNSVPNITYRLQVDNFQLRYQRGPVQAPVPGLDPILIDLGQFRPQITCSGTLRATSGTDGGITIPSKRELEDFVEGSSGTPRIYASTITLSTNIGGLTDNYVGKIAACDFNMMPAREDLWEFRLMMVTEGRS